MTVYDDDEFDSPEEALDHYRKLLAALRTHKRTLQVQLAEYGIAAPTHLRTEFDRVSSEIQQLRERIRQLKGGTPPPLVITPSQPIITPPLPATYPAYDWANAEPGVAQLAVLRMLHNLGRASPGTYVNDTQLADALQMDLQDVRDYMDLLESAGDTMSANTFGGHAAMLTAAGRMRSSNRF
jgi:hypothetical protein